MSNNPSISPRTTFNDVTRNVGTQQIGSAFGLTLTTITFNSVVTSESKKMGIPVNLAGSNAADLKGYKAAQWTAAAFPLLGESHMFYVWYFRTDLGRPPFS